jgi:large subunit ribosomal protein L18
MAQIIDDSKGITLASSFSKDIAGKTLVEKAKKVGLDIAKSAKNNNVSKVVFDRGGFIYTGVIASLAEGAREGGLEF